VSDCATCDDLGAVKGDCCEESEDFHYCECATGEELRRKIRLEKEKVDG